MAFIAKRALFFFVLIFIILAAVPSYYFYGKYREAQFRLQNPQSALLADAKAIVAAVGKLMVLPADEEPTVATVTDTEKLKDQPFFVNAQNGDKVIIYTKARKAILYRPILNKIIDIGPITVNQQATSSATTPTAVKVVLYNGTSVVGLTKRYETELKTKVPEVTVVDRDNAAKSGYLKTIIVDVTQSKSIEVAKLAERLGIEVAPLPKDEATPAADFLIILGVDKK